MLYSTHKQYAQYIRTHMLNQLISLGLSENEARVYLAMLELGPSTMLQIATQAEINRPTAYVQIERLKKLGLVSTQTKGKKQFFIAENPGQLGSVLEEERKTIETKKSELTKMLPELESLFRAADSKPQVRFFEGKEGLLRMKEEFLLSGAKEILAISPIDEVLHIFPDHTQAYTRKRVERGIHAKLIYTSKKGRLFPENDQENLGQTKYISPEQLSFNIDITIFENTIGLSALRGKLSGTIITHPEIANSFKSIFNLLWSFSEKSPL